MLDAYKKIASGIFVRNRDTRAEYVAKILNGLAAHTPSPFGMAFSAFATILDTVAEIKEKERYEKIAHLLPLDRSIRNYSRELACVFTEFVALRLGYSLSKLTTEDMEDLAKRSFVLAIHSIYNVDDLKIDPNLKANERAQELTEKVTTKITKSDFLQELIETKIKHSITPPNTPTQNVVVSSEDSKSFTLAYDLSNQNSKVKPQAMASEQEKKEKCIVM